MQSLTRALYFALLTVAVAQFPVQRISQEPSPHLMQTLGMMQSGLDCCLICCGHQQSNCHNCHTCNCNPAQHNCNCGACNCPTPQPVPPVPVSTPVPVTTVAPTTTTVVSTTCAPVEMKAHLVFSIPKSCACPGCPSPSPSTPSPRCPCNATPACWPVPGSQPATVDGQKVVVLPRSDCAGIRAMIAKGFVPMTGCGNEDPLGLDWELSCVDESSTLAWPAYPSPLPSGGDRPSAAPAALSLAALLTLVIAAMC